jgi:hypothetical protein
VTFSIYFRNDNRGHSTIKFGSYDESAIWKQKGFFTVLRTASVDSWALNVQHIVVADK